MKKYVHRAAARADNRGFSLVELLVAVIILSIVAVPLLHAMATGANTSARSRKMGDATLAFQNIAETIEANSLYDLVTKDDSTPYDGVLDYSQTVPGTGGYELRLSGVKAGNSIFNATIDFNPQKNAGVENSIRKINSQQMADYTNMDAVFAMSQGEGTDPDSLAQNKLNVELSKHNEAVCTGTNRTITLDVYACENKLFAELKFEYTFTCSESVAGDPNTFYFTPTAERYSLFPQGFKTDDNGELKIPGIYIMYNPLYSGMDTVTINNKEDLNFKLFLVKQMTAGSGFDSSYMARITLNNKTEDCKAQVFSNARENLNNGLNINTVIYKINIGDFQTAPNPTFDGAKQGDLVSKTARDRIFDVTIKLYQENDETCSGTPVSEFTTNKLQ